MGGKGRGEEEEEEREPRLTEFDKQAAKALALKERHGQDARHIASQHRLLLLRVSTAKRAKRGKGKRGEEIEEGGRGEEGREENRPLKNNQ